ncbi:hypothetical protein CDL12_26488 [Handroanthus impetiginosus]|uniref:Uncharacterized protein n=1 Tax=Handroanthus impetiginosus TaxID=429701 RepID=A0A2G9G6T0_9LAMI|nr:hypothetical protein CDL12_26488 [Handroanthus impetiginosus]
MPLTHLHTHCHHTLWPKQQPHLYHLQSNLFTPPPAVAALKLNNGGRWLRTRLSNQRLRSSKPSISASLGPLDLTEDNIVQVLEDARTEASLILLSQLGLFVMSRIFKGCNSNYLNIKECFGNYTKHQGDLAQLFDTSVNITGKAELAEVDGPYVKIRLSGRFWHKRSTVLARLGNYLKQRIPVSLIIFVWFFYYLSEAYINLMKS